MKNQTLCFAGRDDWPDVGNDEVPCCMGSANDGPAGCTCWEPVYDLVQVEPDVDPPGLRSTPCGDCAYRGGSPERRGEDHVIADGDDLGRLVAQNRPFFCHQGIRRPIAYRHPSGVEHVPDNLDAAYEPPILNGVPYKADGTPADLCAGWATARLREAG